MVFIISYSIPITGSLEYFGNKHFETKNFKYLLTTTPQFNMQLLVFFIILRPILKLCKNIFNKSIEF